MSKIVIPELINLFSSQIFGTRREFSFRIRNKSSSQINDKPCAAHTLNSFSCCDEHTPPVVQQGRAPQTVVVYRRASQTCVDAIKICCRVAHRASKWRWATQTTRGQCRSQLKIFGDPKFLILG